MNSKEQRPSNDKAGSKQRPPKPTTENLDALAQREPAPALILQRARSDPRSLTPSDVLQLQRTIGNRAVGRLLAQTAQLERTQRGHVPHTALKTHGPGAITGKSIKSTGQKTVQRFTDQQVKERAVRISRGGDRGSAYNNLIEAKIQVRADELSSGDRLGDYAQAKSEIEGAWTLFQRVQAGGILVSPAEWNVMRVGLSTEFYDNAVRTLEPRYGIRIADVIYIAQNMPASRTMLDVVQFARNLQLLTVQQVIQLLAAHPGVVIDRVLCAAVTATLTPLQNLHGHHSPTQLGVGEKADLTANITPNTITADKLGGLRWQTPNAGTFPTVNISQGSAQYTAPNRTGNEQLQLVVASGPYVGTVVYTFNREILEPDNVVGIKTQEAPFSIPGRGMTDFPAGVAGAGMLLQLEVRPSNVSFKDVRHKEVPGPATNVSGYFLKRFGVGKLYHGSSNTFLPLDVENRLCDGAATPPLRPVPYEDGTFEWIIPNEFSVDGLDPGKQFTTVTQAFSIDATGKVKITKAGAVVERTP